MKSDVQLTLLTHLIMALDTHHSPPPLSVKHASGHVEQRQAVYEKNTESATPTLVFDLSAANYRRIT